jgi:K+/H+ antiporter YhaU regulatory subunit KhtT
MDTLVQTLVRKQNETLARQEQILKKMQEQNDEFKKMHDHHRAEIHRLTEENLQKCQCIIS